MLQMSRCMARAIAGLSMGGGHTTAATMLFPGVFDYICPMSCGMRDGENVDAQMQAIKKAGYKLYWIGCGTTGDIISILSLSFCLNKFRCNITA